MGNDILKKLYNKQKIHLKRVYSDYMNKSEKDNSIFNGVR